MKIRYFNLTPLVEFLEVLTAVFLGLVKDAGFLVFVHHLALQAARSISVIFMSSDRG
jgi:hypothetical protein